MALLKGTCEMLLLARQIRDVVVMMVGDMKYVLDIVLVS